MLTGYVVWKHVSHVINIVLHATEIIVSLGKLTTAYHADLLSKLNHNLTYCQQTDR